MKSTLLGLFITMLSALDVQAAPQVSYRIQDVDGIKIFYREAGNPANPTIVLLHGFPSSSHMYRDLIPALMGKFHVIAPDYPGSGYSEVPDGVPFTPTFDGLADVMTRFVEKKGLTKFALYVQDFGGPVGFRMAASHPEWISALVIQNANAYKEGLSSQVASDIKQLSVGINPDTERAMSQVLSPQGVQYMYKTGARNPERLNPDAWTHDEEGLQNDVNRKIQMNLLADYHSNVEQYPAWHDYFRKSQPPTLIVWGKNDPLFIEAGANAYLRDIKNAELHLLDSGHFALEEDSAEIAARITSFFAARPALVNVVK
ncbi:Alpha/beta hydrolase fold precursor [Collimonas arenae]|uniref:Alpha/beta hydrolase fold n=1 Tax=Collimonas arenae TaxID=279058 RepID=A0A0A1F6N6_9BURK|nr:alpha/beta hydrolase [Collimonas arenae]AIY39470.1 Alpha/beta hydrolase fold precursor [Collimonas arenae]